MHIPRHGERWRETLNVGRRDKAREGQING